MIFQKFLLLFMIIKEHTITTSDAKNILESFVFQIYCYLYLPIIEKVILC
jgi:hypothetical protein